MNNKLKALIAGAALITLAGTSATASASDRIGFSITIGSPGYAPPPSYVYSPPPVYHAPRVVYAQPRVVYAPPRVVYAPQRVYYSAPQWRGRDDRQWNKHYDRRDRNDHRGRR